MQGLLRSGRLAILMLGHAAAVERAPGRPCSRGDLGPVARDCDGRGRPVSGLDRVGLSRHDGDAGADGVAVQQHGEERLRRGVVYAIANLSVKSMFPGGSYDAERTIALILTGAAAAVIIVWGPRTLTRGASS